MQEQTFAYRAQTRQGHSLQGTLDTLSAAQAADRLAELQLQVVEISRVDAAPRKSGKSLGEESFLAFNQQLAQLAGAGLPVEQGLRWMSREMGRGSAQRTVAQIATELESGKTLPQAIELHRGQFPPLYAALIDAGVRCGNLSQVLLGLGRQIVLERRLRTAVWQALAYPICVLMALAALVEFILYVVVPPMADMYGGFADASKWQYWRSQAPFYELPWGTQGLIWASQLLRSHPLFAAGLLAAILVLGLWMLAAAAGSRGAGVIQKIPLVGGVMNRNLVARWCDAAALAVEAGMDLPAAIALARDALGVASWRNECDAMIAHLNAGNRIGDAPGRHLPPMVLAAMDAAAQRGDLAETLRNLSLMYQQQAEVKLGAMQAILTPLLLLFMGLTVGTILYCLMAPLVQFLNMLANPFGR